MWGFTCCYFIGSKNDFLGHSTSHTDVKVSQHLSATLVIKLCLWQKLSLKTDKNKIDWILHYVGLEKILHLHYWVRLNINVYTVHEFSYTKNKKSSQNLDLVRVNNLRNEVYKNEVYNIWKSNQELSCWDKWRGGGLTYMSKGVVASPAFNGHFVHVHGGGPWLHSYQGVSRLVYRGAPVHFLIGSTRLLLRTCQVKNDVISLVKGFCYPLLIVLLKKNYI